MVISGKIHKSILFLLGQAVGSRVGVEKEKQSSFLVYTPYKQLTNILKKKPISQSEIYNILSDSFLRDGWFNRGKKSINIKVYDKSKRKDQRDAIKKALNELADKKFISIKNKGHEDSKKYYLTSKGYKEYLKIWVGHLPFIKIYNKMSPNEKEDLFELPF